MNPADNLVLKFPINQWQHLYSLARAIRHDEALAAEQLMIQGECANPHLFGGERKDLALHFFPVNEIPAYESLPDGSVILGQLVMEDDQLVSHLGVSRKVFDELLKNLREYADIEGIHIMVSITARALPDSLNILDVEYAMRGDA